MGPGDNLEAYIDYVRKKSLRLNLSPEDHLHSFVQGLSPAIKEFVILASPASDDEAERLSHLKNSFIQSKKRDTVQLTQDALAAMQSVMDSQEAPAVAAAGMSDPTERHRSSNWSDRSFSGGNMSDILHDVGESIKKDLKHEMTDAIEKALNKTSQGNSSFNRNWGMEEIDSKELGPILERRSVSVVSA